MDITGKPTLSYSLMGVGLLVLLLLLFPLIFCERRHAAKDVPVMDPISIGVEVDIFSNYLVSYMEGNRKQSFPL